MKRPYPGAAYAHDHDLWASGDASLEAFGLSPEGGSMGMSSRGRGRGASPSKKLKPSNRARHLVR